MRNDRVFLPWLQALRARVPGLELFDAHTHIGHNDPDGFSCSPEDLIDALALAGARAAVFPMHEPDGYPPANDAVIAAAERSEGRLVPYCRLDPSADPVREAERCLERGARGIKLHPRAERFTLDHPALTGIVALAGERRLPVLIHAGRGIPALGEHALALAEAHPGARIILAHAAISDLAWLWRELPGHPNLLIDTAWFNAADLLALFALVPPGQIVWASDLPYGTAVAAAVNGLRCALQAGLSDAQLRSVAGAQTARLVAGEEPLDLGPPPGEPAYRSDRLLDRAASFLTMSTARLIAGGDARETLALARLACDTREDGPRAVLYAQLLDLISRAERAIEEAADEPRGRPGLDFIVSAGVLARTPDVPVPGL